MWFDTVAVCNTVFIFDETTHSHNWLSTNPVATWQYMGFLRVVQLRVKSDPLVSAGDLFQMDRLEHLKPGDPVRNLYFEEAAAYAQWFHKTLCHRFILAQSRKLDNVHLVQDLLQRKLRVWDAMRTGDDDESTRDVLEVVDNAADLKSCTVWEWECGQNVGVVTKARASTSMIAVDYGVQSEFVAFQNILDRSVFVR